MRAASRFMPGTFLLSSLSLFVSMAFPMPADAQDWPNWRGPNFNGSTRGAGLPVRFSISENVKWTANLPGPSAATPVIWGDSVFLTSVDPDTEDLIAICLDRKTGKPKWERVAGSGYQPGGEGSRLQLDDRSNYASPSPVTDGKRVVFFFGNGDLIAYDFAGKQLWSRNLQKEYGDFAFLWTFSSTPQIYDGRLYVQILQRDETVSGRGRDGSESYLLALDPATGKELWKRVRPSGAMQESRESYATPIPVQHNGRKEIVLAGGDALTGHDPADGRELWRWETYNPEHRERSWRLVPSPVTGGGVVVVCAPKRAPVYALKAGGSGKMGEEGVAWKSEERGLVTSDVPTPLFFKGKFYILSDVRRSLSCVRAEDGKTLWSVPLTDVEMCWGSPTGADGKVYLLSRRGEAVVVDAESGKILARSEMGDGPGSDVRSSVAIAHGNLFIRTDSRLFCIGK